MEQELTREYFDQKLDEFASLVSDGFQGVQDQFKEVHRRIDETNERIDKLYNLVDGFIGLHQKLDQEFTAIRARYERLEERIAKLEAARA